MYERYTERARQVMALAQEAARNYGYTDVVTPLCILYGLAKEGEGLAARVLESRGITPFNIDSFLNPRATIRKMDCASIPLSNSSKRVLELALHEALSLGHNYIGTEHILLGWIDYSPDHDLHWFGTTKEELRSDVMRMLDGPKKSTDTVVSLSTIGEVTAANFKLYTDPVADAIYSGLKLIADAIRDGKQ